MFGNGAGIGIVGRTILHRRPQILADPRQAGTVLYAVVVGAIPVTSVVRQFVIHMIPPEAMTSSVFVFSEYDDSVADLISYSQTGRRPPSRRPFSIQWCPDKTGVPSLAVDLPEHFRLPGLIEICGVFIPCL